MRRACILGLILSGTLWAQPSGTLVPLEGARLLTVWGTHSQRGYAHGYLVGPDVKAMLEEYLLAHVCGNQAGLYGMMRQFFLAHYVTPKAYVREVEGVVAGMRDAGVSLFSPVLGREWDAADLLVANAIVDLSQALGELGLPPLGCASLSSWGTSTQEDADLAGGLVITRMMDWENHPTLAQRHLLVVSFPQEEDEHPWVSFTFPGFLGGLSGVACTGVAAFLNVGNRDDYTLGTPFVPILWAVRAGLERRDVDGDGSHTALDVEAALRAHPRSSGTITHVVEEGASPKALVVECNHQRGVATRDVSVEDGIPGDHLAATNHFRVLYPPVPCGRYEAIAESLSADARVSEGRSWDIMTHAAALPNNLHVIQYVPSRLRARWATSAVGVPAHQRQPTSVDLATLFQGPGAVRERPSIPVGWMSVCPNPFAHRATLRWWLREPTCCRVVACTLSGACVALLADGWLQAGLHQLPLEGRLLRPAAYVVGIQTPQGSLFQPVLCLP